MGVDSHISARSFDLTQGVALTADGKRRQIMAETFTSTTLMPLTSWRNRVWSNLTFFWFFAAFASRALTLKFTVRWLAASVAVNEL